jgi:hypothetical protein
MTRARDVANIDGILTTKGDIYAATAAATPARLGVGNSGEQLVADSSTTTGLRYQSNFAAGKNAIINGDYRINQRAFTSNTSNNTYNFDRWLQQNAGGTVTVTPQTFTPGTAPVAGYEGINYVQMVTSGQSAAGDLAILMQRIEDVRTFAGQTVTVSFYAKAASGAPKVSVEVNQSFGSGGSSDVNTAASAAFTLSTSWARYSTTITLPSISGKTIGTGSYLLLAIWTSAGTTFAARTNSIGVQSATFQFWGVQVEAGAVATAFQTATGTIQGELAACQRYYWRQTAGVNGNGTSLTFGNGGAFSATIATIMVNFPVAMRVAPTSIDASALYIYRWDTNATGGAVTGLAFQGGRGNQLSTNLNATASGGSFTTNEMYQLQGDGTGSSYLGFSAEL